jgi:hypothetical protein
MKTAVEWLIEEMPLSDVYRYSNQLAEAKEMEKEQIIEARFTAPILPNISKSDYLKEAEQYYKETFKSE